MTYTPTVWADGDCVMAADMNNIENGVDRAQGDVMVLYGVTAARPATDPLLIGRLYLATDAPYEISRDNGGGWDVVGYTSDLFTALGAMQVGSGAGAAAPLGIGAAGEVLTVAGGTATWAAAAGGAWNPIAETILGAPAATVTFAVIAGTYRTLVLLSQARTDMAAEWDLILCRANADAGGNYDRVRWLESTIAHGSVAARAQTAAWIGATEGANSRANNFAPSITWFEGYAVATQEKYARADSGNIGNLSANGDLFIWEFLWHWRSTAAITSLTLLPDTGPNFVAGSRFQLYGIT